MNHNAIALVSCENRGAAAGSVRGPRTRPSGDRNLNLKHGKDRDHKGIGWPASTASTESTAERVTSTDREVAA